MIQDPRPSTAFTAALGAEFVVVIGLVVTIGIHWHVIKPLIAALWGE